MALIINGETIDEEILDNEFRSVKGHFERTLQVACCERDPEFRATARDNVTARVLLNQEALKRMPVVEEADITARLEKLIEEAGGKDQFFYKIGMPYGDESIIRENVANGIRLDTVLGQVYAPEPNPDEAGLRAYYDSHLDEFMTQEMINASHITKGLEGATSRAEVYAKMREIRQQLLDGYDFDKMAEEHRGNEQQQIELGWFKRGEFMEEFETIAFSMNEGEISPVFTTQLGFHICKLTGRKPSAPAPFDEIKDIVRARMSESYRDAKFAAFVDELKAAAKIEDTEPCDAGCGCAH